MPTSLTLLPPVDRTCAENARMTFRVAPVNKMLLWSEVMFPLSSEIVTDDAAFAKKMFSNPDARQSLVLAIVNFEMIAATYML